MDKDKITQALNDLRLQPDRWKKLQSLALSQMTDEQYLIALNAVNLQNMNNTHEWVKCEYCNGTGNAKTITGGCFFCCNPMSTDRNPGYRWKKIIL